MFLFLIWWFVSGIILCAFHVLYFILRYLIIFIHPSIFIYIIYIIVLFSCLVNRHSFVTPIKLINLRVEQTPDHTMAVYLFNNWQERRKTQNDLHRTLPRSPPCSSPPDSPLGSWPSGPGASLWCRCLLRSPGWCRTAGEGRHRGGGKQ